MTFLKSYWKLGNCDGVLKVLRKLDVLYDVLKVLLKGR